MVKLHELHEFSVCVEVEAVQNLHEFSVCVEVEAVQNLHEFSVCVEVEAVQNLHEFSVCVEVEAVQNFFFLFLAYPPFITTLVTMSRYVSRLLLQRNSKPYNSINLFSNALNTF